MTDKESAPNISSTRICAELGKNDLHGSFNLAKLAKNAGEGIFRIKGMWDMYRDMPFEMIKCANLMDTTGIFKVTLNNSILLLVTEIRLAKWVARMVSFVTKARIFTEQRAN